MLPRPGPRWGKTGVGNGNGVQGIYARCQPYRHAVFGLATLLTTMVVHRILHPSQTRKIFFPPFIVYQ
jgi:hypothetical protein